jgi:hypothetical protein
MRFLVWIAVKLWGYAAPKFFDPFVKSVQDLEEWVKKEIKKTQEDACGFWLGLKEQIKKNDDKNSLQLKELSDRISKLEVVEAPASKEELMGLVIDMNKSLYDAIEKLQIEVKKDTGVSEIRAMVDGMVDETGRILKQVEALDSQFSALDQGVMTLTKKELLKTIDQKVEVFEGNVLAKISGLMVYVNEKTAFEGRPGDTEVLKKLARLEGLKDAISHRRSTEELLNKRQALQDLIAECDRDNRSIVAEQAQLDILNWILEGPTDGH